VNPDQRRLERRLISQQAQCPLELAVSAGKPDLQGCAAPGIGL
jgi:hypothetical protein